MKKELQEILDSENSVIYRINDLFFLRCEVYIRNGKQEKYLYLEIDNPWKSTRLIKSRGIPEMMQDIEKGMKELMDEYSDNLTRYWRGGMVYFEKIYERKKQE